MSSERSFSISGGGPTYHLLSYLHLIRADGSVRALRIGVVVWIPLALSLVVHDLLQHHFDPIASDFSVHVRILISIPLVLWAEGVLAPACRGTIAELYKGQPTCRGALDRIIDRAEHLRDLTWVEAVLALLAFVGGQLVFWNAFGPTGLIHGGGETSSSFERFWYTVTIVPMAEFLLLRWLWRWAIWTYVLARISRLPLVVLATHPDRAAGLACLAWPVTGFAAFVLAISSTLSAAWATQLLAGRATVPQLLPTLVVFLGLVGLVACGPLLLFSYDLFRVRRSTLAQYTSLARDYMRQFHTKWIVERTDYDHLLGTQDIQALNDLGGAFRVIEETRLTVFTPRKLLDLFWGVVVPMVPLVAAVVPIEELLRRIGKALLGGLPI